MKRLPESIHKKINDAIIEAIRLTANHSHWEHWEIYVDHWGNHANRIGYHGRSKKEALEIIPSTYSHTDNSGADLVRITIRVIKINQYDEVIDVDYLYGLELTK